MAEKAKHAYGSRANLSAAIASGAIDAYDVLFLNGENETPAIGWMDKNGNPVIIENNTEEIKNQVSKLENQIAAVEEAVIEGSTVKYEILHKPEGALVDYRDKEIRVMCPKNTVWVKQDVGSAGNANMYYMALKAYAPEGAVAFKEDDKDVIEDNTMYYFENNDFAGIDENGRKYSISWLALASHDPETNEWTYYGANSTVEKYIGWYYSVEWYNEGGLLIASDCIRINLSNEDCHAQIKPFYMSEVSKGVEDKVAEAANTAVEAANAYTDEQIAQIFGIVEF